jgi:hypothetical protein
LTDHIDRAKAEAIHACATTVSRAQALERDLDRVHALIGDPTIGRLFAIASTLAEHEATLIDLTERVIRLERNR